MAAGNSGDDKAIDIEDNSERHAKNAGMWHTKYGKNKNNEIGVATQVAFFVISAPYDGQTKGVSFVKATENTDSKQIRTIRASELIHRWKRQVHATDAVYWVSVVGRASSQPTVVNSLTTGIHAIEASIDAYSMR